MSLQISSGAPAISLPDCMQQEHTTLASEVGLLRRVADAIATAPHNQLLADLDCILTLLVQRIAPHARAEREQRTRLAWRDHCRVDPEVDRLEVDQLTRQLGALRARLLSGESEPAVRETRRVLYELHALTRLHFADELVDAVHGGSSIEVDERLFATR